jgi:hypothetical protein
VVIVIFGIPGSFVPAINWSTCNVLDVHTSAAGVCTQLSWHVQPGATSVTKMLTGTLHCQGFGKAVLLESLQAWYLRRSHLRAQLQQLSQAHSAH